mmetsp:Transcript_1612/g.4134  ORF Transcript_1612/g.4134 Transcript_1612/m.4134 type:complete len:239 (+) Transcript_1612:323-1039(+)
MLLNDVGRLLLVRVDITALGEVLVTLLIDLDRLVLVCVNIALLCGVAVVLLGAGGRGVLGADVGRLLALGGVLPRVQAARGRVVLAARGRLSQLAVLPDDRLALPRALVYVPGDVVRVLRGVRPVGVGLDVELAPHEGRPVVEGPELGIPGALGFHGSEPKGVIDSVVCPKRPSHTLLHEEEVYWVVFPVAVHIQVNGPAAVELPGRERGLHVHAPNRSQIGIWGPHLQCCRALLAGL